MLLSFGTLFVCSFHAKNYNYLVFVKVTRIVIIVYLVPLLMVRNFILYCFLIAFFSKFHFLHFGRSVFLFFFSLSPGLPPGEHV